MCLGSLRGPKPAGQAGYLEIQGKIVAADPVQSQPPGRILSFLGKVSLLP